MYFKVILGLLVSTLLTKVSSAQPTSAPPSCLAVTPLSPSPRDHNAVQSCDLCRPLEGLPGSDLKRHRRPHERDLHPHKKAPGISKSLKRSFKSQLPHRKLEANQEGTER
jgi:hypothetical protein